MAYYLAVDLGTTGCRSMVFDEALQPLGGDYAEYPLHLPREGWAEQDPEDWWRLTLSTAKQAIVRAGCDPKAIESIAISSQGITLVPCDEGFTPLCPALSWLDQRATAQAEALGSAEPGLTALTGKRPNAAYTLPKLLWLREHRPSLFSRARWFLMPMSYLQAKLTGRVATDRSMACGTALFDLHTGRWSEPLAERWGIDPEKLPPILEAGTPLGTVLPEVCALLGLSEGCTVAVGGQDQKCAALGAGLDKNTVTVSLGTAAAVTRLYDRPDTAGQPQAGWCGYVRPGLWVTEGVLDTACACLKWVRQLVFAGESYENIDREAGMAESGPVFLPDLSAADPMQAGVFQGLTLATSRGQLARAVMEGVVCRVRQLLGEAPPERLVLFGGGARGRTWCQLMADITGLTVCVPTTEEAAGAGAAMLAALATGKTLVPLAIGKSYTPHREAGREIYRRFLALEQTLER